jgi:hypothetical protein
MVSGTSSSPLEHYQALRAHELELNRATAELERTVLQILFLLNGGASVAVLGLLGSWSERISVKGLAQIRYALYAWAAGLVVATAATFAAYLSQRYFSRGARHDRQDLERKGAAQEARESSAKNEASDERDKAKQWQAGWWCLVAVSVICFIVGAIETAQGVSQAILQPLAPVVPPTPVAVVPPSVNALALLFEQASRPPPWLTPLIILAALGAVSGLLLAIHGKDKPVRAVGVAFSIASIFGGGTAVTLFKDVKVELPAVHLAFPEAAPQAALERVTQVGPFSEGKANVLEERVTPPVTGLDDAVKELTERAKGREVTYAFFIGSADKFELLPQLQTQYGSNVGLARARGEWVKDGVRSRWKGAAFEAITLTVGPNMHGAGLSPKDTAGDRSVAVYVAWKERPEESAVREVLKAVSKKTQAGKKN